MKMDRHERIVMARNFLGIDKADMAREIGIATGTLTRIESGLGSWEITIRKIEKYFDRKGIIFLEPGDQTPGGRGIRFKSPAA